MSAANFSAQPSGAELVRAIRAAASAAGRSTRDFARPLSSDPTKWLKQVESAVFPSASTVDRVRALLAGEKVPPPPAINTASRTTPPRPPVNKVEPMAVPPSAPVLRDPCWRCGVRGDVGCAHQPLPAPYDPFAHQRAAPAPLPGLPPLQPPCHERTSS